MMFRFRLKTLLVFAMVAALASIAWAMISPSFWESMPQPHLVKDGNMLLIFPQGIGPPLSIYYGLEGPPVDGKPTALKDGLVIPLWHIAVAIGICIAAFIGSILLLRSAANRLFRRRPGPYIIQR